MGGGTEEVATVLSGASTGVSRMSLSLAIAPILALAALAQQPPTWRVGEHPRGSYAVDTAGSPLSGDLRLTIKPSKASGAILDGSAAG